jgi:UTP:GlnB (protein PII) uridylyltransferase
MAVWRLEIASRDQLGLLALVTGVLERAQLDVVDAVLATWGDGAALQAFRVRTGVVGLTPDADAIHRALLVSQNENIVSAPVSDATVSFDDAGSPWHTISEVRATDRRGLLHALAVAFAAAGADVHSARITTNDSMALDRFDMTDRLGRKLEDETKAAIRLALANGVQPRPLTRRVPWRSNRVGTIRKP